MSYKIEFSKTALKQLKKLSSELQDRIQTKIDDLALEPRPNGVTKLKGDDNSYRIRVGNYRVVYDIYDDVLVITVIKIDHRSKVYKDNS